MELFTYDRLFKKKDIVDAYNSLIWTERYYGDNEVELVAPVSLKAIDQLRVGTFVGIDESDQPMILETMSIENNQLKVTGISILPWLNNRIVRHSPKHEDRYWYLNNKTCGSTLWWMLREMASWQSNFIQTAYDYGIEHAHQLGIDGLILGRYDNTGPNIDVGIPYGPLYDAMREIATTYEMGMRIILTFENDTQGRYDYTMDPQTLGSGGTPSGYPGPCPYFLEFTAFRGDDRSSAQSIFPVVRFSPQTDSLKNIKELQSAAGFKTVVYTFAPSNPANLATGMESGRATILSQYENAGYREHIWSFDVRALMVFADDITTDQVGTSAAALRAILDSRAADALTSNPFLVAVDGEISPEAQFKFGRDYGLGDIIEVQGNSGVVQRARVTEFIRAKDASGERNYPTVQMFSN